jgi:hypothetical protein
MLSFSLPIYPAPREIAMSPASQIENQAFAPRLFLWRTFAL